MKLELLLSTDKLDSSLPLSTGLDFALGVAFDTVLLAFVGFIYSPKSLSKLFFYYYLTSGFSESYEDDI